MEIEYGFKITTKQTGATDYNLGCVSGVLKWATGRADLGEFKNGIVLKDSVSQFSKAIQIAACGSYGTMSAGSLKIDNASGFADAIRDLGLNLIQADAVFYTFRDGVATEDWNGKVRDWSYDEDEITIDFMDSFRGIHKSLSKKVFDTSEFPFVTDSIKGKAIPLSFGLVSKAKLFPVGGFSSKNNLVVSQGITFKVCAAQGTLTNGNKTLSLYTDGIFYSTNAAQLVGKYLSVISGGVAQFRKIVSNVATASGLTSITLEKPLDVSTPFIAWSSGSPTTPGIWAFEVVEQYFSCLVSENEINSFETNDDGFTLLFIYDSSSSEYLDVAEASISSSLSDINGEGSPGLGIATNLDSDGNFSAYFAIRPFDIKFEGVGIGDSWDGDNTYLSSQTVLFDGDKDTYKTLVGNELYLFVYFPEGGLQRAFDDIYILLNATHKITSGSGSNRTINITVTPLDVYFHYGDGTGLPTNQTVYFSNDNPDPVLTTSFQDFFLLPGVYFNNVIADSDYFYRQKDNLSISPLIDSVVKSKVFPAFQLKIDYSISTNEVRIKEIGFVGKKNINVKTDSMYTKIKGEVFGSTWDGRKTTTDAISNIAEMAEALFRVFDGKPEVINNNGFDVLGDSATGLRKDWKIGRQILDEMNTAELVDELCRFGFFGIVPKNDGTRTPVAWMDGVSVASHNDTNATIIENTIGEKKPTSLADVANDIQVNYGWNPGSGKHDGIIKITKIDEVEFPAEATLDSNGVALWKSFAVGYNDGEYSEAKTNWDYCHLSYLKYGIIQPLPEDMANAKWFPNVETEWSLAPTYNAAKAYVRELCKWTPFRKDVVPYRLPNTATHAALELLDRITFADSTDRAGAAVDGWIVGRSIVPGLGKDYIQIDLMLEPDNT